MRKILFLVALALTVTACDKINRTPFGDAKLVLVENQTKGLKGLEYDGNVVLPVEYAEIRLEGVTPRITNFVAVGNSRETLYSFVVAHGDVKLNNLCSGQKITKMVMSDKDINWIAADKDGKTVWHPWVQEWKKTGPWDEVFPGAMEYVVIKNGALGVVNYETVEVVPPSEKYEDIIVFEGSFAHHFCIKQKGQKNYSVNRVVWKDKPSLKKDSTLSQDEIDEIKDAGKVINPHYVSLNGVSNKIFNKYCEKFGAY